MTMSFKTLAMGGLAAVTIGLGGLATTAPADAQVIRGHHRQYIDGDMAYQNAPPHVVGYVMTAPQSSGNFGYPNWPYGDGYYGGSVFDSQGYGAYGIFGD
jgi:hypothetical protein